MTTRFLRDRSRLRWLAALAAAVALATAATAGAVVRVVSLRVGTGYAKRMLVCGGGTADPFVVFHPGSRIVISGSVKPKPSVRGWRIKVRVKRCVKGHFHSIWSQRPLGRADGAFTVTFSTRVPGLYLARAYYGLKPTLQSPKQRFSVR